MPLFRVTVRAAIAPLLDDSRASATQVSQLLRGHPALGLERSDEWVRVRGADQYEGWCHRGALRIETLAETSLQSAWRDARRMSLGCTIRTPDGNHRQLPLGAFLDEDEIVIAGLAMNHRGRARYFAPTGELLVQRAKELFWGAPYLWGGVTPWGVDCSGLVQTLFALSGIDLPRDAWQQADVGVDADHELDDLRAGDLLFFSSRDDQRITHVAMSQGGATVIHSSLANGGVANNRLDDPADPVAVRLRETFQFARRVL